MRKAHIDRKVAALLGMTSSEVSLVTSTFLAKLMEAIVDNDRVVLAGFGQFRLKRGASTTRKLRNPKGKAIIVATDNQVRIWFKKSHAFNALVRDKFGKRLVVKESEMEKLGVNEGIDQEAMEKAAANGCPECGSTCERHGPLVVCPKCGTAPFERE